MLGSGPPREAIERNTTMQIKKVDAKIDAIANETKRLAAKADDAGFAAAEKMKDAAGDVAARLGGAAKKGERRVAEAAEKASHAVGKMAAKVVHGAHEAAQKVADGAKELAGKVEQRGRGSEDRGPGTRRGKKPKPGAGSNLQHPPERR